jgi:hypothetical protein
MLIYTAEIRRKDAIRNADNEGHRWGRTPSFGAIWVLGAREAAMRVLRLEVWKPKRRPAKASVPLWLKI